MSGLRFTEMIPGFGAKVEGFDPSHASLQTIVAMNRALDNYGVLLFQGLELTESQQLDFSRMFGQLNCQNARGHALTKLNGRSTQLIWDWLSMFLKTDYQ